MTRNEISRAPRRNQFGIRALFVVLTVLAMLLAGYGWFYRQYLEPAQQFGAIEKQLKSLSNRRPPELTPGQWESAVAWTLQLHGNSLPFSVDGPTMRRFDQRLANKLRGKVNLETIHWIWDEYAAICPHGAAYQRFRAVMMEEIEAGGGDWNLNVP